MKKWVNNPNSKDNRQKQLIEKVVKLPNTRKPWTNEETDAALEAYLDGKPYYRYGDNSNTVGGITGRSPKGFEYLIWSVATNNNGKGGPRNYCPVKRIDRIGEPWGAPEKKIVWYATSPMGAKNMAYAPWYIARVLGRKVDEVHNWMFDAARANQGGFFKPPTLEEIAQVIHRQLS